MRILFLGNNWAAWQIVSWLREQQEELVGLILHPEERRTCGAAIIEASGIDLCRVQDGSKLRQPEVLQAIGELKPEIGVSVLFGYILKPDFLSLLPAGCINLHPGLLPYNRGAYPNVWSIVEGTPAGVTIHYVDEGVDTGDVIAQKPVASEPVDTGASLYRKLELACVELFKETWPMIRTGRTPSVRQSKNQGSYHRLRDVEQLDEIDLDRTYTARYLIDVIRARSFPPYSGAYFRHDGRKIHLRLQLLYDEQLGEG